MSVRDKYERLMQQIAAQASADEFERERRKAAGAAMLDQLRSQIMRDASWLAERGYKIDGDARQLTLSSSVKQISCDCDNDTIRLRVADVSRGAPVPIDYMAAAVKSVEAAEEMIADLVRQFGPTPQPAAPKRWLFGRGV
jgi:hypothetical protein